MIARIRYFDEPGPQNTDEVIEAVRERLERGGIDYVIVASISGRTALRFAERIRGARIVCVSGPPQWDCEMGGRRWPYIPEDLRARLNGLGVQIVDRAPTTLAGGSVDYSLARYGYTPPSWAVVETLVMVGGYGLKTAIEVTLMAVDSGAVPPGVEAIAVGGTLNKGADTAVVLKTSYSTHMFSSNSDKRMEVREILAMPRIKRWYGKVSVWEFEVSEVKRGDRLE